MYLWIVIAGGLACFYNSWGIGANDCANSFATSVGAKVLTLRQAIVVAAIFEFLGAFLMGSHVTSTIRKKIVNLDLYENDPGVLMMGMLCANISSGVWLHLATYLKLPVSTTHSIIGAILGFSLAYGGSDSIKWDGVWKIMLSWIISPILSGVFALIFYLSMKRYVLNKDDAIERTLKMFPILTLFTFVINTFFIFYKGTPQLDLDELPAWKIATIVTCVSVSTASIAQFLYVPYARKKVNGEEYGHLLSVRFCHKVLMIYNKCVDSMMSVILRFKKIINRERKNGGIENGGIENGGIENEGIENGGIENEGIENEGIENGGIENGGIENGVIETLETDLNTESNTDIITRTDSYNEANNIYNGNQIRNRNRNITITRENQEPTAPYVNELEENKYNNNLTIDQNIKNLQKQVQNLKYRKKAEKIELLHQNANVVDPNVEQLCSSLQVITACFSSFAHGANDVANSIAPFATIYGIYLTNEVNKEAEVPIWILFMGGVGIVLGLATWGYRIIDRIGKELTKITASRGFIIELSAALTVLIASRSGMPVSTTHCQIGGVFGCGIGDGKRNIQWKLFRDIVLSWVITLPVAGLISATLFSFAIYSP